MDLGVPLLLVRPGKLSPANVAGEGFLPRVSANVCSKVIGSREGPHADTALERLLARVDPDVAGELVGARESAIAVFDGTSVRPFVHWCLAGPIRVLAWLHRDENQRACRLLADL